MNGKQIWGVIGLSAILFGLANAPAAAGPTGYGATRPRTQTQAPATTPEPAATAEPAEGEQSGDDRSWWQKVKLAIAGKSLGLDESTSEKLVAIQQEDKRQRRQLEQEIVEILTTLDESRYRETPDSDYVALFEQLKAKRSALSALDNTTFDRVHALIGTRATVDWVLAQRSMMQKMKSTMRRAAGPDSGSDTAAAAPRPQTGSGYGYR